MRQPSRRSFNDEATRGDEPPPQSSTGCTAYGCPVPAGIVQDGKRFCCVHLSVRSFDDFPAATQLIRKHPGLVDAIAILRAPGFRLDQQAIEDACRLYPALNPNPKHRYALLVEAETMLRQLCLTGDDAVYSEKQGQTILERLKLLARNKTVPV